MKPRPEGETKKERRLQRIVGVGVVVIFLLLGTVVLLGAANYQSQTDHHTSTVKADAQILSLTKEVRDAQIENAKTLDTTAFLQKELGTDFANVSASLLKGQAQINAYLGYLTCLLQGQADCGSPPPLPSTTG